LQECPGADLPTFSKEWLDEHIRSTGPLGEHYPYPCCIHEGAPTPVVTVIPRVPGVAHVILVVEDDGSPRITSCRRAILEIAPADQ